MNTLYYGDNLDILRRYVADETVDLVYLDPPFNSNANYNVLFAEKDGSQAAGQIQAFTDTWTWDLKVEGTFAELVTGGGKVGDCMQAFRTFLGPCDMLAYLVMMAPRLVELRRVMKPTASIYLHCDPTASHYLKMLMDAVFGAERMGNEVVWQRTNAKGLAFSRFARNHDIILRYTRAGNATWNAVYAEHDPKYLEAFYRHKDPDGRVYRLADLTNPNKNRPNLTYEFMGVTRVWRWTRERMQAAADSGLVVQSRPGTVPQLKRYLDEQEGTPVGDVWTDIRPVQAQASEKLGYPTQKPVALLERIIQASSNQGDVVLDPFCGCGTALDAAQGLGRQWIGIDVTHLAVNLMKKRLHDRYGLQAPAGKVKGDYAVIGEPTSVPDAEALAASDPYQFQWWALGLVGARPVEQKKGADKGIDGKIVFLGDAPGKFETVILSVKAGHTMRAHVHELRGVVEREKAAMGVLIAMQEPTGPMREDAVTAGFWHSGVWNKDYPKIQLLTVAALLDGAGIEMPPQREVSHTFKRAAKAKGKPSHQQPGLFDQEPEGE